MQSTSTNTFGNVSCSSLLVAISKEMVDQKLGFDSDYDSDYGGSRALRRESDVGSSSGRRKVSDGGISTSGVRQESDAGSSIRLRKVSDGGSSVHLRRESGELVGRYDGENGGLYRRKSGKNKVRIFSPSVKP